MTETPPICSYEGSDYPTSFWEQGGRAYEDEVESIALGRLLPRGGARLLELGAGGGRNTLRYVDFKQIVLLDYSVSQLEHAQKRLGSKTCYRFVAADIYRLPFMPGSFDCATMIRTLHHMANPHQALEQVQGALQKEACFILEFANKRNLKAILRYWLRRQSWDPFTQEPVEFAELNFDFHPKAIRKWLADASFHLERTLTVSHFRTGFLKKHLPLKTLVQMDSVLQPTGNLFQLSPSVFTRSKALNATPALASGSIFRCPSCGFGPLEDTPPQLKCPKCHKIYPVKGGIYDFRVK
jgi:ubiquinone/menaquinone biosynthesis C-methylase UbiE